MTKKIIASSLFIFCLVSGVVTAKENKLKKEVIVYFPSWNLGDENSNHNGEVAGLPWEYASYINHAFWEVRPSDGSKESSFEQRKSGKGARTKFEVASLSPKNDFEDTAASKYESGLKRNHFSEYEYFSKLYPDVKILLSIGGWTRSGYFSEMAFTNEGRTSCIESIIQILKTYPWLGGIDIDWEYPGCSIDGERKSSGGDDQGCPIFGTVEDDKVNFALFLKELRDAMTDEFGDGKKKLTACAAASTTYTLPCQDWKAAEPYIDLINVMTYDLAGVWSGKTGHNSGLSDTKTAIKYFNRFDIQNDKLCIGSPLYGVAFKMKKIPKADVVGAECEKTKPTFVELSQTMIADFESKSVEKSKTGWHKGFDSKQGGAYIYNDSSTSKYYKWYISYESKESLQAKLDFVHESGVAGIIVWESTLDTKDYRMIRQMANSFQK